MYVVEGGNHLYAACVVCVCVCVCVFMYDRKRKREKGKGGERRGGGESVFQQISEGLSDLSGLVS